MMSLLCSTISFAKTQPITVNVLLQNLKKNEPWDKRILSATKMAFFKQIASGSTDASRISKVTLGYFTTSNCSGSNSINIGSTFGLVAASARAGSIHDVLRRCA